MLKPPRREERTSPRTLEALLAANVGKSDRAARVVVGVSLLAWLFVTQAEWGWVGLYPLLTGIFGRSPLYVALGINTHRTPAR